jgi:hypothetical protein
MLENIKSEGCNVVPEGHHESTNNDIQWSISFPGEHYLLLDLTDVQMLCYLLIKIILRETLKGSGVVIPYQACYVLVCGALFMSMGRLKLH